MPQVVVQNAVLYVSNLIVGKGTPLAEGIADFVNVATVKCIAQPVRVVVKKHKSPSSRETTDLSIAVIVINRSVPVAQTTNDRVGHFHDQDCCQSR